MKPSYRGPEVSFHQWGDSRDLKTFRMFFEVIYILSVVKGYYKIYILDDVLLLEPPSACGMWRSLGWNNPGSVEVMVATGFMLEPDFHTYRALTARPTVVPQLDCAVGVVCKLLMAIKYVSLIVLAVQNSALILTMRYSRTLPGPRYRATTAVMLSECLKCLLAFIILLNSRSRSTQDSNSSGLKHKLPNPVLVSSHTVKIHRNVLSEVFSKRYGFASMLVPAILYTVQNNLQYMAATNLDAATFQATYQGKILATAFFAALILRQKLTFFKWLAILILTSGVVLISYPSGAIVKSTPQKSKTNNRVIGLMEVGAACMTSGFAGVYLEYLLKKVKDNRTESGLSVVWIRNLQLCFAGALIASIGVVMFEGSSIWKDGMLYGYNAVVWFTILLQAGGGMVVALVIIHADNILKNFATTMSTVISTTISVVIGDCTLTANFLCGVVLVLIATNMYGADGYLRAVDTVQSKESHPETNQPLNSIEGVASSKPQHEDNGTRSKKSGLLSIEESHEKV